VNFARGEGLHQDSTVDARIEGHDAYVSSFPNEIFSVIIPLLIGVVGVSFQIYFAARAITARRRGRA
jgi:hypothetical protein